MRVRRSQSQPFCINKTVSLEVQLSFAKFCSFDAIFKISIEFLIQNFIQLDMYHSEFRYQYFKLAKVTFFGLIYFVLVYKCKLCNLVTGKRCKILQRHNLRSHSALLVDRRTKIDSCSRFSGRLHFGHLNSVWESP